MLFSEEEAALLLSSDPGFRNALLGKDQPTKKSNSAAQNLNQGMTDLVLTASNL